MSIKYAAELSLHCDHPECRASASFWRDSRYYARLAAELGGWHVGRKLAMCPAHNPTLKRETHP